MEQLYFFSAPEESRKDWYVSYLSELREDGDESAANALKENERLEKKLRMDEALEKRKKQAEEQRGKLGRELDSERRKFQAGNSRFIH